MKNYYFLIAFLIFNISVSAQISPDGLLAYYPFDGDVLDHSLNSNDGLMFGGTFEEDQAGNQNSALLLNGVDEFVDLSVFATPFRVHLEEFSIYFKIKFEKTEDSQTILSLGSPGEDLQTNVFEVEYENNQVQVETETGNSAINHELAIGEENSLFDGEWHEILILLKDDSLTYCKDNDVIYKGLYVPAETNSNNFYVGCYGGTSNGPCCFFGGYIDELQFYNRLITKDELPVSNDEIISNHSISFYPNPTQNSVKVTLGKTYSGLGIRLYNLKGETVLIDEFSGVNEFEISLPFSSGVYFLQIYDRNSKEKMVPLKIVLQ